MTMSAQTGWYKKINANTLLFYTFVGAFFAMPLGTGLQNIMGGCAALIWLFSGKITQMRQIVRSSWIWPVFMLIALPWIGLLYTPDNTGLGLDYAEKTHYWIYCLAIASISFKALPSQGLIIAFLAGIGFNAIVAVFQVAGIIPSMGHWEYHGFGLEYNTLSAFLIVGILVASNYFKTIKEKKMRLFLVSLMLLFFFHLVFMKGRNGYFTFILLSPLVAYNLVNKLNIFKISLVCTVLIGLMYLSPMVRNRINFSIIQISSHLKDNPDSAWGKKHSGVEERFYIMRGAFDLFMENPLFGVGTGGFYTLMGKKDLPIAHPHNNILYMAVSFGVFGIFALLWVFWEVVKNAWEERHSPIGFFVLSVALVIFVSGIFNSQIIDSGTAFLFAVSIGLQQGFPKFEKENALT